MMNVTWLHVSDFHSRGGDPYDRDVVLRALVQSVKRFRNTGRTPDVIFATGDIAYSGKVQEYALATEFFDDLLEAAGLKRLF
jgi:predicted MPP superfamily phosphohydrolase